MKLGFLIILLTLIVSFARGQNAFELQQPLREIAIIASKTGFFPKSVSVHQGEKVRFFLTSTYSTPDCLVLENHKVFLAAEQGKISEKEVVFETPGRFKFYCPSSKHTGYITVIEKSAPEDNSEKKKPGRDVASKYDDGVPDMWTPKDY